MVIDSSVPQSPPVCNGRSAPAHRWSAVTVRQGQSPLGSHVVNAGHTEHPARRGHMANTSTLSPLLAHDPSTLVSYSPVELGAAGE